MRISDWSSDVCSSDVCSSALVRRLLGQPQPIGLEPPFQHPFRLIFLGRNETDSIFVQAFGRKILLDVAGPAKFIFGGPFRGGKRFGVADNHGAVLVSHAISPARLSSVTPASAPRIAPLTALQCGRTRQFSSSAHSRSEEHTSELQSLMR